MSFFAKLRRERQARQDAKTELEFSFVVLAVVVNDALKSVQVSGHYRFSPEEMDIIEQIITRYPDGPAAAVSKFFPEKSPHPHPWQTKFIEFLASSIFNAIDLLSAPTERLTKSSEWAAQIPISRDWRTSRLLIDAENVRNRVKPEWLSGVPREVFADTVEAAMEPILSCVELVSKQCPFEMVEMYLPPAYGKLYENRGIFGPRTNKWIDRIESDPKVRDRVHRSVKP